MGGTFLAMNKVIPAAYLNFVSSDRGLMSVGDRGVVSLPLELNWGAEGELIEVLSEEMQGTAAQAKLGFTAYDAESKLANIALQNCYKGLFYRLNKGGEKATATIGTDNIMTVTALYSGTFGNKITIQTVKNGELVDVATFVDGEQKDIQTVATIEELEANAYVTFSGNGAIEENAGKPLAGGTNGEYELETAIPLYLDLLKTAKFQTFAIPQLTDEQATFKSNVATFVEQERNDNGRYIQGVLANYPQANFEGIISNTNGAVIDGVTFTKEEFTAYVAGITAGANINESNTNKTVRGATKILGELDKIGLEKALKNGEFVLKFNQDGEVTVVQDINSYHTYTKKKNKEFHKNRVLRVLDEIGTTLTATFERSYMGKVDNTQAMRDSYRGDADGYFKSLEGLSAIQEYVSSGGIDNIICTQGDELDIVKLKAPVKPVDSMEFLYAEIEVRV